ncbi:AAA family ATPase [Oleidesulfovibrio sp.]|uniref:AAA family ATPase n=1 Tax=Oleidesulfovibrio sp. TaxID=2909707 RepID=UPI003A851156
MPTTHPVCLLTKSLRTEEELSSLVAYQSRFHLATPGVDEDMGLVIVELGNSLEEDFETIDSLVHDPRVGEIFITATRKDPDLIIRAMRAGVTEFLEQPFKGADVNTALEGYAKRAHERERSTGTEPVHTGRIVHIIGAKGGVGATTVAVNLAVRQARMGHSAAIMDMRLPQGEVPLFLDMEYARTWADAAREVSRLDATFLQSLMEGHESGLQLLASPDEGDDLDTITTRSVKAILNLLRAHFEITVIDGGPYADELALVSMQEADEVLLVSEMSLPALAGARKLLDGITRTSPQLSERVRLVLNRHTAKSGLSVEEAEALLERKTFSLIDDDYEAALSALNQGQALCDAHPRSPAARALSGLADRILPVATTSGTGGQRSGGLLARFLHRASRNKGKEEQPADTKERSTAPLTSGHALRGVEG